MGRAPSSRLYSTSAPRPARRRSGTGPEPEVPALFEDDARPVCRREQDAAASRCGGRTSREAEARRCEDRREYDLHLDDCERHSRTASLPPTEREPCVWVRLDSDEPFGTEEVGIRVEVRPPVGEVDHRRNVHPDRDGPASDLRRHLHAPSDRRDDGPEPQRLLDDRIEVLELQRASVVEPARSRHRRELFAHPEQGLRVRQQEMERPGESELRRFVPREEERHELVAQLFVAHELPLLVCRMKQQGEDVLPRTVDARAPPCRDQGKDVRPRPPQQTSETFPRTEPRAIEQSRHEQKERRPRDLEQLREIRRQLPQLVSLVETEDGPEDDLHRDGLHVGTEAERTPQWPRGDRLPGQLRDDVEVGEQRLSVQRRKQDAPAAQVHGSIEQEDRIRSEERANGTVALSRLQHPWIRGKDLPQDVGRPKVHPGAEAEDAQRERLPVAPGAGLPVLCRSRDYPRELDAGRGAGSGWERQARSLSERLQRGHGVNSPGEQYHPARVGPRYARCLYAVSAKSDLVANVCRILSEGLLALGPPSQ